MKGIFTKQRTRGVSTQKKLYISKKSLWHQAFGTNADKHIYKKKLPLIEGGEKLLYAVNHTIPELTKEEFVFSAARVDFVDYTAQSRILRIFA